ncbi:MAG: SRPBCC domain-containing protein [Sphingomonadales bacterium]|nr:SRPBCC domain-containing protein [Sphingomonadales bacterium]
MKQPALAAFLLCLMPAFAIAQEAPPPIDRSPDRVVKSEIVVPAPVAEVWSAWTTSAGIQSFFARGAKISLDQGGAYEIYFLPDAEEGQRGSEGTHILGYQLHRMLHVTWALPPYMPALRHDLTTVLIHFIPEGDNATRVVLVHSGWGRGDDWDAAYAYFLTSWDQVLDNLVHRFSDGPIDWDAYLKEYEETGTISWWRQKPPQPSN